MAEAKTFKETGTSHCIDCIRVLLVDEHEAMREGLRHMLGEDKSISVVGDARDSQEALTQASKLHPDVVIVDEGTRNINGIETIRLLQEAGLPVNIVILTDNNTDLAPAIEAGVVGFLPRNISRGHLITAIRIIHLWRLGIFNSRNHFALVKL
jgi:DNA-binding NarL/FixJ family response regulator